MPGGDEIEAPFISAGVPVKGSSAPIYLLNRGLCLHFSEMAHTSLSSWKARIFSFLKTYLDFFLDVSSLLDN